jgi:NAD(P)-dependent dehydrogenase (short-subunit alcohol dehydrogenase family)
MPTPSTHVVFGAGALGQEIARQLAASGATVRLARVSGYARLLQEPEGPDAAPPGVYRRGGGDNRRLSRDLRRGGDIWTKPGT